MTERRMESEPSADLIGYRLELIEEVEQVDVERQLAGSPALRSAMERLDQVLAPLASDKCAVPSGLIDGVLQRIEGLHATIPIRRVVPKMAAEPAMAGGSHRLFSARDLIGLAAAILVFVGIFFPGYRTARMAAQRTVCNDNLRHFAAGLAGYAEANADQLPFVSAFQPGMPWAQQPTQQQPGFQYVSNSRNVIPLINGGYVAPQYFIDPARNGDRPLDFHGPQVLTDFPSPRNNSYSLSLVDGPLRIGAFDPRSPMVADMTPLMDDNHQLITHPDVPENSQSHGRLNGQNVLRADGSVVWTRTPRVGLSNDDIYRVIGVQRYTGMEQPRLRTDAFLIP